MVAQMIIIKIVKPLLISGFAYCFSDPGETRTLNQQNRNLSFYPLNYGTG
jgi:hypothetical protein